MQAIPSDNELVQAFQAGDVAAFELLYQRYARDMRRVALRYCANPDTAEDLCAAAWWKAYRYMPHGTMHSVPGYVALLVKQRWWRMLQQTQPSERYDPDRHVGGIGSVEGDVLRRENEAEIVTVLQRLPADYVPVAILKLVHGFDLDMIAVALDLPKAQVKKRWRQTRRYLSRWFASRSLDYALTLSSYERVALPDQCCVPGCSKPRHALNRCKRHADDMLAKRRTYVLQRVIS